MPKTLEIIRGDTVDILVGPLEKKTATGWAVPDFAGATPRLIVVECASRRVLYANTGTFASPGDEAAGIAAFPQAPSDFAGTGVVAVEIEVEITYASGQIETFPKGPVKNPGLVTDDLD